LALVPVSTPAPAFVPVEIVPEGIVKKTAYWIAAGSA